MGTLFSSLDIGVSGLRAAQIQLDVAAHNIANVNKPGYSRQRVELTNPLPNLLPFGQLGRGVLVSEVTRIRDQFLDLVYRQQVPRLGTAEGLSRYYALIEDAFLEPSENGFGTRLSVFFDALSDFSNNVEDLPVREVMISEAAALAGNLNELAERFNQLRTNANEELRNLVPEINSLAEQIAALNVRIRQGVATDRPPNDLRDDRDVLIDDLSRLINISYTENTNGEVTILVGSDVLVDSVGAREIEAVTNPAIDPERPDFVELRFVDNSRLVTITDGEAYAAMEARDHVLADIDGRLDDIAAAIIWEINKIHSQGNGLTNLSGTLSSTNVVNAPGNALIGGAGLPFPITAGSFDVVVYDATNTATTTTINVTGATTLNSLAASLNAIPNFSASVVGNTLQFGTSGSYTFAFANDTSGALAALGINGLFVGTDARTIAVNPDLQANPEWISSGYSLDVLDVGDNTAALDMANVRNALVLDSGASTIGDYYESTIAQLGVDSRANQQTLEVQRTFVDDFDRRRQEVSGVSIDEEVASLLVYQRAFEASARVVTVTDRMLETLLTMAL